jgi:hypothetical protein
VSTFAKFLAKLPKRILELLLVRAKRVAKVLDERGNLALELKKCEQASEDAQNQHSTFKIYTGWVQCDAVSEAQNQHSAFKIEPKVT